MRSTSIVKGFIWCCVCFWLGIFSGCTKNTYYAPPGTSPENFPLTDSAAIEPGLEVRYYDNKYKHIDGMPKGKQLAEKGRPGNPVLILDNVYGKRSNVFGSGKSRLIGIWFSGMIHLDQPGAYYFQALSNDGIRVFLNREMLFEDPERHSSRLSPVGLFNAEQAGWYPIQIIYYQRKGTAALRLYWKKPGAANFKIVPAVALGHAK